jgi:ParB/RepB/Spo0J family partition protein
MNQIKDYPSIPIDRIVPNPWNPNVESEFIYDRLKKSITEMGFIDPITVRELQDGTYQILNGEHRFRAAKELGIPEIPVLSLGVISDTIAQQITLVMTIQGQEDNIKLAKMIKDLAGDVGMVKLSEILPYTHEDLQNLMELLNFDMASFRNEVLNSQSQSKVKTDKGDTDDTKWLPLNIKIHSTALDVINTEFSRIESELQDNLKHLPLEKRRGMILTVLCDLSARTPSESLE